MRINLKSLLAAAALAAGMLCFAGCAARADAQPAEIPADAPTVPPAAGSSKVYFTGDISPAGVDGGV